MQFHSQFLPLLHPLLLFFLPLGTYPQFPTTTTGDFRLLFSPISRLRLRLLEFNASGGNLAQVITAGGGVSGRDQVVVGERVRSNSRIVLECRSGRGPVEFSYQGDGAPTYSVQTNRTLGGRGPLFWGYLTFDQNLRPEDSGNYSCRALGGAREKSFYLFVPAEENVVFVPNFLPGRLATPTTDEMIRVPCSVTHPNTRVQLLQGEGRNNNYFNNNKGFPGALGDNGEFRDISSLGRFDPRWGFLLPMSAIPPNSPVALACRGQRGNGQTQVISFRVLKQEEQEQEPQQRNSSSSSSLISPCGRNLECGPSAECVVVEYNPHCICLEGFSGAPPTKPCRPDGSSQNPPITSTRGCGSNWRELCGPNSDCVAVNGKPICSCLPGAYGSPPTCFTQKPPGGGFCRTHTECDWGEKCEQGQCLQLCDPPGKFCGENARCIPFNHTPYCECKPGYSGNPYRVGKKRKVAAGGCVRMQKQRLGENCEDGWSDNNNNNGDWSCGPVSNAPVARRPTRPPLAAQVAQDIALCASCGPNSVCRVWDEGVECSCIAGTSGTPPECRWGGCRDDKDCSADKACVGKRGGKCVDPCSWANCPANAECQVRDHLPVCICPEGTAITDSNLNCDIVPVHPCLRSCGPNTVCREVTLKEVLRALRREGRLLQILLQKENLRSGRFSECRCREGFQGNPYSLQGCWQRRDAEDNQALFPVTVLKPDPCEPSPCGPSSSCVREGGRAFCRCAWGAIGTPPNCSTKCTNSSHCLFGQICRRGICVEK